MKKGLNNELKIEFRKVMSLAITLIIGFVLGCNTIPVKPTARTKNKSEIEKQVELVKHPVDRALSENQIRQKMKKLSEALNKGSLTENEWLIHDELLGVYSDLKNQSASKIVIPARSKIHIPFETYCLDPNKAAPNQKEQYVWQKSAPGIKYFKELLQIRREGGITKEGLQTLIWNLKNETTWENYPPNLKAILLKVDPNAAFNLPSDLKNQAKNFLTNELLGQSGVTAALDAVSLVKGKFYELAEIKNNIESLISKYEIDNPDEINQIPETSVFSESESNGYSSQEITFYNPTEESQEIDLNEYYLQPERQDVQRIALNPYQNSKSDLLKDLEKLLYETMLRLGIGFTPGLNDVADIFELMSGKDFLTGEKLSLFERVLSGVGVIAGSGQAYRYANRAINSPAKYLPEFEKGIERVSGRVVGSLEMKEVQSTIQSGRGKINEISNFYELKQATKFLKDERILSADRRNIIEAFRSETSVKVLANDTKVYRYWQEGVTAERGHWVTTLNTSNPVKDLALPVEGVYKTIEWVVPKGTKVIDGLTAPKFGKPGGGHQMWLSSPEVLKK